MRWHRLLGPGVLGVLAVAVILPLGAAALRGQPGPRCALDGVALFDAPIVRLVEASGSPRQFCCVGCAERWITQSGATPQRVTVTDADQGDAIDARAAWFVRSTVVAQAATRDHVHAFATESAAREHAAAFRGRILTGDTRPFGASD